MTRIPTIVSRVTKWKALSCMAFYEVGLDGGLHRGRFHLLLKNVYLIIDHMLCKLLYLRGGEEVQDTNNPNDLLYTFCIAVQESIMAGNRWSPKPSVAFYRKGQGMLVVIGKELIQFDTSYKVLWRRDIKTHFQGIQEAMLIIGALEIKYLEQQGLISPDVEGDNL